MREQSAVESVVTPDHVEIKYDLAGIGSRAVAAFIDGVIIFSVIGVIIIAMVVGGEQAESFSPGGDVWVTAIGTVVIFVIQWGYYTLFEAFWNGQTPGKKAVGIRVIREGGYSMNFMASMIRNLLRIADGLPVFYGVGIAFVMLTPNQRRLGDLVAGTLVVKESGAPPKVFTREWIPASAGISPARASGLEMSHSDLDLIQSFLSRRFTLSPELRSDLAEKLLAHLRQSAPLPEDLAELTGLMTPEELLVELLRRVKEG